MNQAADALQPSPRTTAIHKYAIMEQLGLTTSAELAQYAVQLGLVGSRSAVPPA